MHYIHFVPGRLRVRADAVRGCPAVAERIHSRLLAIRGVHSVTVNDLIGSILICYDHHAVSLDEVWSILVAVNCVREGEAPAPSVSTAKSNKSLPTWAGWAVDAVAGAVVQKVAEASVMALVRALI